MVIILKIRIDNGWTLELVDGVPMDIPPGQLVLNRLGLHCPRCSAKARVEVATDSETIQGPQPQGQPLLFEYDAPGALENHHD